MADISQIKAPNGTTYNLKDSVGRKESYLEWGGKNFSGSFGVIDASLVSDLGANRLMFAKAAGITIEYSRDAGSTWTDYGASDAAKVGLFSSGASFAIGKADSSNKATANGNKYQLRVTLDTGAAGVYTWLNKFVLYVNTSGSASCTVKIQKALQNAPTAYTDVTGDVGISGWSGYNVINVSTFCTYGNTPSTQYGRVRFIFKANGGNTSYNGLMVTQIMGFGGVGWTTPSTMAKTGHLYSFDSLQNATFPARVTATEFSGKLANRSVDATTVNNTSGTFAFSGSNDPFNGTDWVGLQVGDDKDKFQIVAKDGTLMMRQNDSGGSNTGWQNWAYMAKFASTPTSGRVVVTQGGAGGIISSEFTIAKSVPADAVFTDTDTKVTQLNSSVNSAFRLLLSDSPNNTDETSTVKKSSNFTANPSTGAFFAYGYLRNNLTGTTTNLNDLKLSSGTCHSISYIEQTDAGTANITNRPVSDNRPFILDVELIRWASTTDYISRQTYRDAFHPNNEYVRYCTNGTWGAWVTRVFTDTNTKVNQSVSTTSNWRKVLLGFQNDATFGANVSTVTDVVYASNKLEYQPSTGTLKTTTFEGGLIGNATSSTSTKYLENQGGSTVSVGTSTWNNNQTKTALVWGQRWSQTGLTYTPSGGEATSITDTGDISIFLTQSTTSNHLFANLAVDGKVHAASGFVGNLTGTASALSGLKLSTAANLGIDSTDVNQKIGYVNGLTKADWNYQQPNGSLYQQTYSADWIHQIYGDYRTGQISVRGRSNGTWQAWRRVLDEGNFSNFALPLTGGTMTGGIILQTGSSGFNDNGLVWANNAARIGASPRDLALYAKGSIYLRPNSETAISSDGIIVTTDGLFPGNQNGTETLGGVSSRWANVWSKEGNFSDTVLMSPGENFIQWQDSGNWSATNHLKEGESFPINRGGLYWTGQSDWVKLYAQETAVDELDLVLQFGDDANPRFNIQNKDGTNVAHITAGGEVGAITGTFSTSASSPKFIVQGTTYATNTYADNNPKIDFRNASDSQNISLTFTDYDSVQNPTSLTLNGNQGNEYFIAPNIKATTKFHGNLDGTASKVTFNADNNSGQWNALLGGRNGYVYYDGALQWLDETDSTNTRGSFLSLGNSTATGTSGNKRGVLRLWGSKSYCMDIYGPDGITANRVLYLPDTTNTGHIVGTSTTGVVGSVSQPVYIASSGIATAATQVVGTHTRSQVTTSPNFDSPALGSSFFEVRSSSETTGETGTKPFDGWGPMLSLRVENVIMQLAYQTNMGLLKFRGKQGANATGSGLAWKNIPTYNYSTTDLTAGSSNLTTGEIYLVYE